MSKFGHVGFQLTILCMKYKSFSLSPWQIAKKACPPTTCGRAYHHRKSPTYNLWPGVPSQEIHDLQLVAGRTVTGNPRLNYNGNTTNTYWYCYILQLCNFGYIKIFL